MIIVVSHLKYVPHTHCSLGQHSWHHPECYNGPLSGNSCSGWGAQTAGDTPHSNFLQLASSYRQHQAQNKNHRRRNTVPAQTQPIWFEARLLFCRTGKLCLTNLHKSHRARWQKVFHLKTKRCSQQNGAHEYQVHRHAVLPAVYRQNHKPMHDMDR